MQIRVEQLNPTAGDIAGNKKLILAALRKAEEASVDLLILPEMVLTGYPVQDLLENPVFRETCYQVNGEIVKEVKGTALLFGSVTPNTRKFGRKMYNSALLALEGKLCGVVHKTLLPTYDVFDDLRYFEPNKVFNCLDFKGVSLGVTICEDIWYNQNEVQYHTYEVDPAQKLKENGADIIINISASPYTNSKHENRKAMLRKHAADLGLPVLYANQVGAHTDVIFDGDSMVIAADTEIVAKTRPFEPSFTDISWSRKEGVMAAGSQAEMISYPAEKAERQFAAIRLGLKDYIVKTGVSEKVVLGLSGGIDSALVAVLAAETLGTENVTAITMPAEFSSSGSVTDSKKLAGNLGITLLEVPIKSLYKQFNESLNPIFNNLPFGVAEENLQSRIRGVLLMAFANKYNNLALPTGNKSEYATGYATVYGDMNGALAIIGDLYKSEVFAMARWLNDVYYQKQVIPDAIITKPPSAELRPDQKDSDSLPEYEVLDDILYRYIELQQNADKIISSGYDSETVKKILRLVDLNEFKRYQAAPILKLSSKSFGSGRRWPVVQNWTGQK